MTVLIPSMCLSAAKKNESADSSGEVLSNEQQAVPFANVVLKNSSDSSFVKVELTDEKGNFLFQRINPGDYFLEIRATGFQPFHGNNFTLLSNQNQKLGTVILVNDAGLLQTVNVVGDKPFIEKQIDRTVVNVENSIVLAGTSILDLMEKLPGVQVNQDGNITLRGKSGIIITIDGKQTGLSGQDLGNLLKGMSSASIHKIEIITNPSSKYDAAGNAGIINIVMKKNKRPGTSGSISAGYGQGRYEKYNSSFNLGYKSSKFSFLFNYNYSHRKAFNNLMLTRYFYTNDTLSTVFDTYNYIIFPFNTHAPRMNIDLYLNKSTTVSALLTGVLNDFTPGANNHTDVYNGSMEKTGSYDFTNVSTSRWYNYSGNVQLKHDFDTNGTVITADLDFARYLNQADQLFTTTSYDGNNSFLNKSFLVGDQGGDLSIYSARMDYTQSFLSAKMKMEAGLKTSYVTANNDVKFYNRVDETDYFDTSRSSHFLYSENINAAYVNVSKDFQKFSLQTGLRAEHTLAEGQQLLNGQEFYRNYVQLFPTVFADYKLNKKHTVNISFGRRIDRPAYEQMNPFRKLIDATTYAEGNPFLKPQFTWNAEAGYTFNNSFFITAGYSLTNDNIMDVLIQDSETKTTVQSIVNLYQYNYYNLSLTFSRKILKWWNTNTNLLLFYGKYAGTINNYTINQGTPAFTFSTSNSFTISDGFSAELGFIYNHKVLYGVTMMRTNYNLSAGLQKSLFKKNGSVTVNINDIFWTAWPSGITHFGNVDEFWFSRRETRVVNVTFTWRFGKGQAGRMRRNTGADEEKRRTGNG